MTDKIASPSTTEITDEFASTWREGDCTDVHKFLSDHPEVQENKAAVVELAYEEYCLRLEAGEKIAPSTFCDRFPTFRISLRRRLDVHDFLESNPGCAGTWFDDANWPEVGEEFIGFKILRELGRGAIARVYLASQAKLGGRLVAVKVSLFGGYEAETLGKLSHPNIVPVFSVDEDPETRLTAVCMPYRGSATLADVLDLAFAENTPPDRASAILDAVRER